MSSYVINETHYFDNGKNLLIDPIKNFLLAGKGGFRYRKNAITSLVKGFKLETMHGRIEFSITWNVLLDQKSNPLVFSEGVEQSCLCASRYSTGIEIAICVVLFGNILIAFFLVICYRRYSTNNLERILSTSSTKSTLSESETLKLSLNDESIKMTEAQEISPSQIQTKVTDDGS